MGRSGALLCLVAACLACSSPRGPEGWYVDGTPVPDTPWRGHDGSFLAMLILTDDPESVYDAWNTKPGSVAVSSVTRLAPGARVEAIVFFVGCEPDDRGDCGVWGTATVTSPDGTRLADRLEIPLWVGRPPPPDRALGIAEHGVGMSGETLPGPYVFEVLVTDRITGREVPLREEVVIVE